MIIPLFHNYRRDTDEALMPLIQRKDERAFDELFLRYARKLQGFFWRRTGGNEAEAADLTQEVFLRVWEKAKRYNPSTNVHTWVFSIAYNLLTDHYRHIGYQEQYTAYVQCSETEAKDENVSILLDKEQFDKALSEVLTALESSIATSAASALSEAEQLLFDLRFTQELSVAEIAVIIQIPEGTVKSRLHSLTQKLRLKLHQYESI